MSETLDLKETMRHSRRGAIVTRFIETMNISDYKDKTFEQIIIDLLIKFDKKNGLGRLTAYDISAAICKYYDIEITKIYIIGPGPRRAAKLLKLKLKSQKICSPDKNIILRYVDIKDVNKVFDENEYKFPSNLRNTTNGDLIESFICKWQSDR
jgi:hypothetical protein